MRDVDRHDLAVEAALFGGAGGAQVRLHRERVVLLAGDAPLLGDQLGRDALRHEVRVARESSDRPNGMPYLPSADRRAHRHGAHVLDAGRDHDVVRAGDHALRREVRRLLRRTALAVDRGADGRFGEAGRERGVAADVDALRRRPA